MDSLDGTVDTLLRDRDAPLILCKVNFYNFQPLFFMSFNYI